jgi:hypothetical protein
MNWRSKKDRDATRYLAASRCQTRGVTALMQCHILTGAVIGRWMVLSGQVGR